MTTESLKEKTSRYLNSESNPSETRQIQNWLSCTNHKLYSLTEKEKKEIEAEILDEIQGYTAYPLFYPKPQPWWQKVIPAFFTL